MLQMGRSEQGIIDKMNRRKGEVLQEELVKHEAELDDAMASLFAAVRYGAKDTRRCLDRVLQACYNIPVLAMRMAGAFQPDLSHDITEGSIRPLPSAPHLENLLAHLKEKLQHWHELPISNARVEQLYYLSGLTRGLAWFLEKGGSYAEAPGSAGVRDDGAVGDVLADAPGAHDSAAGSV